MEIEKTKRAGTIKKFAPANREENCRGRRIKDNNNNKKKKKTTNGKGKRPEEWGWWGHNHEECIASHELFLHTNVLRFVEEYREPPPSPPPPSSPPPSWLDFDLSSPLPLCFSPSPSPSPCPSPFPTFPPDLDSDWVHEMAMLNLSRSRL